MNPASAVVRDVTLRDGLQLTGGLLPTSRKVELVRALLAAGLPSLEIGSMARPDLVPPLANTVEVIRALRPAELDRCWVWVATAGNVRRAVEAGARNLQYCVSVSEAHNRANIGRSVAESMAGLPEAHARVGTVGGQLQLCLATSFTCPFAGRVDPDRVVALVEDPRAAGVSDIVVCDTLGQAVPAEVSALVARVSRAAPDAGVGYHGHDTWGLGVANSLAAIDAGAGFVDGAVGGLGGCPFAPGASGNTATEDLLFALRPAWLNPDTFASIVRIGEAVTAELDEPNRSRAAQGARAKAAVFEWAIGEG